MVVRFDTQYKQKKRVTDKYHKFTYEHNIMLDIL